MGKAGIYDIIRADRKNSDGITKEPLPALPTQQCEQDETKINENAVYDTIGFQQNVVELELERQREVN